MRIAITGGTGFVGAHLARALLFGGHEVVLLARGVDQRDGAIRGLSRSRFVSTDLSDPEALVRAFEWCDGVAHLAGINREKGRQTFRRVHVEGTRNVVEAARQAGAGKVVLLSFLRARPGTASGYHQSKWEAEEIVRRSGLDFTVLKAGVIYGRGDHMLDHLSRAVRALPVFPLVGMEERAFRPVAVEDVTRIIEAALVEGRLSRKTVRVVGPEEMPLRVGIERVAEVLGRRPCLFHLPVWVHHLAAWAMEGAMEMPLASRAQVRMLAEGVAEAEPPCEDPPEDLLPRLRLVEDQIRMGLPEGRSGARGASAIT